jgi:hypothetical protein
MDSIPTEDLIEYLSNKILDLSFLIYTNNRPINKMHILGEDYEVYRSNETFIQIKLLAS